MNMSMGWRDDSGLPPPSASGPYEWRDGAGTVPLPTNTADTLNRWRSWRAGDAPNPWKDRHTHSIEKVFAVTEISNHKRVVYGYYTTEEKALKAAPGPVYFRDSNRQMPERYFSIEPREVVVLGGMAHLLVLNHENIPIDISIDDWSKIRDADEIARKRDAREKALAKLNPEDIAALEIKP